ncbi:hypothetical protein HDV62DRAFT_374172 [Trichoderma sp. SZMC 28011]
MGSSLARALLLFLQYRIVAICISPPVSSLLCLPYPSPSRHVIHLFVITIPSLYSAPKNPNNKIAGGEKKIQEKQKTKKETHMAIYSST